MATDWHWPHSITYSSWDSFIHFSGRLSADCERNQDDFLSCEYLCRRHPHLVGWTPQCCHFFFLTLRVCRPLDLPIVMPDCMVVNEELVALYIIVICGYPQGHILNNPQIPPNTSIHSKRHGREEPLVLDCSLGMCLPTHCLWHPIRGCWET